jgi:hypothetical protein
MAVATQPQTTLDEHTVEDAELEAALEAREQAKDAAAKARKAFGEADESAKTRIRELELGEMPTRCGRFVIAKRDVAARSVAFDTEPTTRLTIRTVPAEAF